jgi:hypothetical protein
MHKIRRLAAIVGVTALASAFVAGPADAATLETYLGSAAARGLNVKVVNPLTPSQNVQATLGSAVAKAASDLTASATGSGQVLPELLSTTRSAAATAGKTDDPAAACALAQNLVDVVAVGVACGDAKASVENNLPVALSEGSIAGLTVDGQTALGITGLNAVTTTIGSTLGSVLNTVCSSLSATCPATTTVQDLVSSILNTRTLDVSVGKSTASVVTDANKITSSSTASGAVVKILPLPQVNALPSTEPLATIEIASAKASAVYDRAAGQTLTPTFDPALVRVKFNTVLTQTLGMSELAVVPGQDIPILVGTPFESRIIVGAGRIVENADKTKGAVADGVKLRLLMPLGESAAGALDGGITLELAHAEAGVAGAPAVADAPLVPLNTPDIARELPRTGGTPWIPVAGVAVLALAVLVRRTAVKASVDR